MNEVHYTFLSKEKEDIDIFYNYLSECSQFYAQKDNCFNINTNDILEQCGIEPYYKYSRIRNVYKPVKCKSLKMGRCFVMKINTVEEDCPRPEPWQKLFEKTGLNISVNFTSEGEKYLRYAPDVSAEKYLLLFYDQDLTLVAQPYWDTTEDINALLRDVEDCLLLEPQSLHSIEEAIEATNRTHETDRDYTKVIVYEDL